MRAKVIAVCNQKGGVGKSAIAGNLAGAFIYRERYACTLDMDPQGSLTIWANQGDGVLKRINRKVGFETLAELKDAINKLDDFVVILDTPPSMADPALMAAAVADVVLIPCTPALFDLAATHEMANMINAHKRAGGLPKVALVPSKVQGNTSLGRALPDALADFAAPVLPAISHRALIAQAAFDGKTVHEAQASSPSAQEFEALAIALEDSL